MIHTLIASILSILLFLFHVLDARAVPADEAAIAAVVVQLRSDRSHFCGSGFVTGGGRIITNAHVAAGVCPNLNCSGLRVAHAAAIGGRADMLLPSPAPVIERFVPSLDFAVISLGGSAAPDLNKGLMPIARGFAPQLGQKVAVYGYPRCGVLERSDGAVSAPPDFAINVSSQIDYGSSGSPVLDDRGALVGLVMQADSVSGALLSIASGSRFGARALLTDIIATQLSLDGAQAIAARAKILLNYRSTTLARLSGVGRVTAGLDFTQRVEDLRSEIPAAVKEIPPAAALSPSSVLAVLARLPAPRSEFAELFEQLMAAAIRENSGTRDERFQQVDVSDLLASLQSSGRSESHLQALRTILQGDNGGFAGLEHRGSSMALAGALALLALAIVWGWSTAAVFFLTTGSRLRRVLIAALVGIVLWPLSLAAFLSARRRTRKN